MNWKSSPAVAGRGHIGCPLCTIIPEHILRELIGHDDAKVAARALYTVQHTERIIADPQLLHRGTPVQVPHPHHGTVWVEGTQARWSRTRPGPRWGGPPVGHHTQEVLETILGYSADRIAELVIAGALG